MRGAKCVPQSWRSGDYDYGALDETVTEAAHKKCKGDRQFNDKLCQGILITNLTHNKKFTKGPSRSPKFHLLCDMLLVFLLTFFVCLRFLHFCNCILYLFSYIIAIL